MKRRNPQFGCRRIAQQISFTVGIDIDKDAVRRVLAQHCCPDPGGPSWLTFLGHCRDSLWSADLFRCQSLMLKTHWVMVVMDQFTRRLSTDNDPLFECHRWKANLQPQGKVVSHLGRLSIEIEVEITFISPVIFDENVVIRFPRRYWE